MATEGLPNFGDYLSLIVSKLKEYWSACENEKIVSTVLDKEIDEIVIPKVKEVLALDLSRDGEHDVKLLSKTCGSKKRPVLQIDGRLFASAEALDGEERIIKGLNLPHTDRSVMEIARELHLFFEDVRDKRYWEVFEQYAPAKTYNGTKEMLDMLPTVLNKNNVYYDVVKDDVIHLFYDKRSRGGSNAAFNMIMGSWISQQNGYKVEISNNELIINDKPVRDVELSIWFDRKNVKDYFDIKSIMITISWENGKRIEELRVNVSEKEKMYTGNLEISDGQKLAEYVTDEIFGDYAKEQFQLNQELLKKKSMEEDDFDSYFT